MLLLAQATNEIAGWTSVVSTLVNIGFSALVGWYLLTKALPKVQDDFLAALATQREHYDTIENRQRADTKDAMKAITEHCERESARHDELFKVEMRVLSTQMESQGEVMEQIRECLVKMNTTGR